MVVIVRVESQVISEAVHGLCSAPGSSKKPIHVGSDHGGGVIKTEDGIPG